jgi:hypothetical protein
MQVNYIFKNSKDLQAKDVAFQLLIGIAILLFAFMIEPLRQPLVNQNPTLSIVLSLILVCLWTFRALKETTIKEIRIDESGDLQFQVQKRLGGTTLKVLKKQYLIIKLTSKPDRFRPQNKILKISDHQDHIKLSTRQKGIGEKKLDEIYKKLKKHYPQ